MSIKEIINRLENYTVQCRFSHFSKEVAPPFMVYLVPDSDNFNADNKVYYSTKNVQLELYTRENTLVEEEKLESYFDNCGIIWNKSSQSWHDEEKVMMTVYSLYG